MSGLDRLTIYVVCTAMLFALAIAPRIAAKAAIEVQAIQSDTE